MSKIIIEVRGAARTGKSTIMEMIHDVIKFHFRVGVISSHPDDKFPPTSALSKRIKSIVDSDINIVIIEKQTMKGAT